MTVEEFGNLFRFIRNGMNVKQNGSGGVPITRIETISNGTVDASRVGYADLDEHDCAHWMMRPGDILFSHINETSPELY
jgi:type I restriction enzyme S subunit